MVKLTNKNIHNDNNNPNHNGVHIDKIKTNVENLNTYGTYNGITLKIKRTIGKTNFMIDNNANDNHHNHNSTQNKFNVFEIHEGNTIKMKIFTI